MVRKILEGLAFLALGTISAGAFAQETPVFFGIACAHSKIAVPDGLRCQTTQNYSGYQNSDDAGGTFRNWAASGAINGVQFVYLMTEVTSMDTGLNPTKTLQDTIKGELPTAKATNFSALVHRGGADFTTFTIAAGNACVGIRRYGPSESVGYRWILTAVRCEPPGRATSEAEIDRFIAGAKVRGS
jgi:hypothetical protein